MKKTLFLAGIICCLAPTAMAEAQPWDSSLAVHRANEHVDTWSAIYTITGEWIIDDQEKTTFLNGDVVQVGCYKYEEDTHAATELIIRSDVTMGNGFFIGGKGYTGNKDKAGFLNDKPANNGIVRVEDGASVTIGTQTTNGVGSQINVAQGEGGRGSLYVDGAGTMVRSNYALNIANNSGAEGYVKIDHGAELTVQGGEKLTTNNNSSLQLGNWQADNTTKALLELDHGSTLNVLKPLSTINPTATGPYIGIADSGEAALSAKNNSTINFAGSTYVALYAGKTNSGSHGAINLESGSVLNTENLYVAYLGTGEVNLSTGAKLNTDDFLLGWENEATSDILSGAVVSAGYVSVGYKNVGTMNVSGSGTMLNSNELYIGDYEGSKGTLLVSDGALINAPVVAIGCNGAGTMTVSGAGTEIQSGVLSVSDEDTSSGLLEVKDGAKVSASHQIKVGSDGTIRLKDKGDLLVGENMIMNGTFELQNASHTIQEGQIVQTSDGSSQIHLMDKGTLVNYGTMNTYGDGVEMVINPEGGSRFQTGTMRVTGRGPLDDDANDINILSYNTGLQGNVKVALPSSGTVSLGSVLEGVNAAGTEYELQKIYLRDYDKINDKLMEGLGLSEAPRNNIRFDYETRHVILVLSTDEVNMHDGTHTVSVAEGSGVIIENGGSYKEETKVGTIGSYSSDGGNTTEADIRVSEAASAQGGMQSSVEWHGSSLETISGEDTTLTDGVTLTMTDKTQGEEQIGPGTLKVKEGSSLTNNGTIKANTVVEKAAALKGSGTMGKTDVKGSLVVGNSPGHPSYTGDLTLYNSSDTTFSVAGLDTASSGENIGWESNTYSHITMLDESKLILPEKVHLTVEFGGESIYTLGGYHEAKEFSFELQLVTGGVVLPIELSTLSPNAKGFYDITNLVTVDFTVTNDAAAGIYTAANMDVVVDSHQFLVESDGKGGAVNLHLVGHGTVSVPEPMTGTLSLLALAALVARRRRH